VASLWQVSDLDAAAVMTRFYRNLWEAKTGISTLEALRQAQLDVLRGAASRGIGAAAKTADEQQYRAPPQAWAAWVLAGDWR
jgi:CHAT domain-containing protein